MSESPDTPLTVVNIISTGLSGSTWINLLLGSHPQGFSIGEMRDVRKLNKAVCVLHDEACPVWSKFDATSDVNWFRQIETLTGKTVLVLNNGRKFMQMQYDGGARVKYIHLVRDGRAVAASMMRKYTDRSIWKASRLWKHDVKRNERLINRQPKGDCYEMIYEKVKADTPGELERFCDWLGVAFDPGMVEFWNTDHHYLGGNKGTLFGMTRKAGKDDPIDVRKRYEGDKAPEWDLKHYENADPAKFVDERWRRELSAKQLRVFAWVAGRLNKKYGYV